jgi:hypothetical protein
MAINWGGAAQNNNALAYFAMGQQIGQGIIDSRVGKATANVLTGGMQTPGQSVPGQTSGQPAPMGAPTGAPTVPGQPGGLPLPPMAPGGMTPGIGDQHNRDMGKDWATIARYNPQLFGQLQQRQQQQAQAQQAQQQKQAAIMRQLLEEAGTDPQRAFYAARQMNIDTSGIPQPGTPEFEPWRQTQLFILKAVETPEGQKELSGIARELLNAGYKQGTPEFEQAMRGVINSKYASEYVDEKGNTLRRSALNLQGPPPPAPVQRNPNVDDATFEQFQGALQALGPKEALAFYQRSGARVKVSSPDQAQQLPPGTRYVTPDGQEIIR